jgi:poly-gamma-glutamate synthesis protein (capsule biosynthesis protein)
VGSGFSGTRGAFAERAGDAKEESIMSGRRWRFLKPHAALLPLMVGLLYAAQAGLAQAPQGKMTWDQGKSVYNRRVRPKEVPTNINWDDRISTLLREEPGDIILTAVGDMIFNQKISDVPDPDRKGLLRIMQEADIAYGNLEFSINEHPELQRPFYNFRAGREFAWEVANIGINMVSMANNHAMDFGPEGLQDCLRALDLTSITHAGAGLNLAAAHSPGTRAVQSQKTKFSLLSYMRYWTARYRSTDPGAPSLATIDPAVILVARDGKVETVEGPQEDDVKAMEDDVVLAKRHAEVVMVALHNHDVQHHRAYGIQNTTPPNEEIMYRRAIDAGADMVLGSGPHVLRGIEIYKGKPIFYSLSDFIYQYRTPDKIPIDLIHQRDTELARPTNVSVWDRRDTPETMEGVLVRMTVNSEKLRRIQLIPVTIDDEGPLYGVPRLVSDAKAKEIIERLQELSKPYKTRIVNKGWYAEVELEPGLRANDPPHIDELIADKGCV